MDDKLKQELDNAASKGATKDQLKKIYDDYKLKSYNEVSIETPKKISKIDDKLKQELDNAASKGATKDQLKKIYDDYNPQTSKGENAEQSGGSDSVSAQSNSFLDSENYKDSNYLSNRTDEFESKFKGLNNKVKIKDKDSGKDTYYDPNKEDIKVDPLSGKSTVIEKNKYSSNNQLLNNQDKDDILSNIPKDTQEVQDLENPELHISDYIKDRGLEGKVANPLDIIKGEYLLGKNITNEEAIKKSGIDLKDFNKYYKGKIDEVSDKLPFYRYENLETNKGWFRVSPENMPITKRELSDSTTPIINSPFDSFNIFDKVYEDRKINLEDKYNTQLPTNFKDVIEHPLLGNTNDDTTGKYIDDKDFNERVGDVSKYGINVKDYYNFLKKTNPYLAQSTSDGSIVSNSNDLGSDNKLYNGIVGYTEDRLNYLDAYNNNLKYRESRGQNVTSELDKVAVEKSKLLKGVGSYIKDQLPNLNKALEEKREKTVRDYLDFKNNNKKIFGNIFRFGQNIERGANDAITDMFINLVDKTGFEKQAQRLRNQNDLNKMLDSDSLLYSYEDGKVVYNKGNKYLVTENGNIIDAEAKKNITSIADDIGLDVNKIYSEAKETDNHDYSFSMGNTSYMMGDVIGNLGVQLLTQSIVGNQLGAAKKLSGMLVGGAMSYTSTYENVLQQLREQGMPSTESSKYANDIASIVGTVSAVTSYDAYNPEALKLFTKNPEFKTVVQKAIKLSQEGEKKSMTKTIKDYVINKLHPIVEEGGKEVVQENLEYLAEKIGDSYANKSNGQNILDDEINSKDIINNSIMAFAASSTMATLGRAKENRSISDKIDLYNIMSNDVDGLKKQLSTMTNDGFVTKEKADALIKDVQKYKQYANTISSDVSKDNLFKAIDLVAERNIFENEKKNVDKAFHPKINEKINEIDNKIDKIITNEPTERKEDTSTESRSEQSIENSKTKNEEGETKSNKKINNQDGENIQKRENGEKEGVNKRDESVLQDVIELSKNKYEYTADGEKIEGSLKKEGNEVYLDSDGKKYKLGNIEDISNTKLSDLGLTLKEDIKKNTEDNNSKILTREFKRLLDLNKPVDLDKEGNRQKVLDIIDRGILAIDKHTKGTLNAFGIIPMAAKQGLKAVRAAVVAGYSTADAIEAGIKAIKSTDWYKKLSKDKKLEFNNKNKTDIFSEIIENFSSKVNTDKEIAQAHVDVLSTKQKGTKAIIRENTGQTDTSKKIVSTEAKLLREKFKNLQRGFKEGVKETNQLKKDFINQVKSSIESLGSTITKAEVNTILNQVGLVNSKNIDLVNETINRLIDRVDKRKAKQKLKELKKFQKQAVKKAKTTYGNNGENVRALASIDPEAIPSNKIDAYYDAMQTLARGKDVDFKEVNKIYESLKEDINDYINKKYQEKLNKVKETPDNSQSLQVYKSEVENLSGLSSMSDFEKKLIHDLKKIPLSYIKTLSKNTIDKINKSMIRINQDGYIDNKVINDVVMKYNAFKSTVEITTNVGDKVLKPVGGIGTLLKKMSKKDFESKDYEKRFFNVMLQHIDRTLSGLNGTTFYDKVIHPVTAGFNKAAAKTMAVTNEFSSVFNKAVKSSKKSKFDLNVLLQFYLRQREFESNPELHGTKVFSLKDHMKELEANEQYVNMDKQSFNRVMELYKSTPATADEMYKQFNPAEKAVISFIDKHLKEKEIESRDVNNHLRGETLLYTNDFFPRENSFTKKSSEGMDINDQIQSLLGSTSVKSNSSYNRIATKANPLRFDTSNIFMSYIRSSNIENVLAAPIKQVGMLLSNIEKSENKTLNTVAVGLKKSVKSLLEAQLRNDPYTSISNGDKLFKAFTRRAYSRMLTSPLRFLSVMTTDTVPLIAFNLYRVGNIRTANKNLDIDFMNAFHKNINSVQSERISGSRSVDMKDAYTSSLSKSEYRKTVVPFVDRATELFNKNKVTDASDYLSHIFYDLTDKPSQYLWKFHLADEFKKINGSELNGNKYATDAEYRMSIHDDLQKATTKADKLTTNLYNTASSAEQKIDVQQGRRNLYTRFNSFMRSFTFNENKVFWDSLSGSIGIGNTSFESRSEAMRTFAILNIRGIAYSYASQMTLSVVSNMLGFNDDDENINQRALKRAFATHAMLIIGGNRGAAFEMVAGMVIEGINKSLVEEDRKYDPYKDSILHTVPEKGTFGEYLSLGGAEGNALKTLYEAGDVSARILYKSFYLGEKITQDEWVEYKAAKIGVSLVAQTTGFPIDIIGTMYQKSLREQKMQRKKKKKMYKEYYKGYN